MSNEERVAGLYPKSIKYAILFLCLICMIGLASRRSLVCFGESNETIEIKAGTSSVVTFEGVSGKLFKGEAFRSYDGPVYFDDKKKTNLKQSEAAGMKDRVKFIGKIRQHTKERLGNEIASECEKWSVVTTIFDPSDALYQQAKLLGKDWCLAIIGDRKGPRRAEYALGNTKKYPRVVYLDADEQEQMAKWAGSQFLELLPWNHFGRKNLGYLYALANGAKLIYDFDDDNALFDATDGNIDSVCTLADDKTVSILQPKPQQTPNTQDAHNDDYCYSFNPYNSLGAPAPPEHPIWPRGLPLDDIRRPSCIQASTELQKVSISSSRIAVCQSLAQHDPDVDGIFRLTRLIPFNFTTFSRTKTLAAPPNALPPFNAQATIFKPQAYFMLPLPITVHGRVSDIWRSYFGQRILNLLTTDTSTKTNKNKSKDDTATHHVVVFEEPFVIQRRNAHNYMADFDCEQPLYMKATALVKFLIHWQPSSSSQSSRDAKMEQLFIDLHDRGYIEQGDITLIQEWIFMLQAFDLYQLDHREDKKIG